MRARLADASAAAADRLKANGARHEKKVGALQAALKSAREAERSARRQALEATAMAAERSVGLEQKLRQREEQLRKSKLENGKLSRELEEVKQRTNTLLIKTADDRTHAQR
ncbi:hypothetical protein T492DRAFT_863819 [Pavlovales sp. CCMP2436]|nr:hypothetical protein T492DRAFT_863819 [Pavlovales sp. CCMP2436]